VDRDHSWSTCIMISSALSLCITVDILQYSMPLAFLPSVLEDRGHTPMKIATAIGVYYWTGFAGGSLITCYQIWCLLSGKGHAMVATVSESRLQIKYLIFGLLAGSATLAVQAMHPHIMTHISCRFIQGFAGAFIFFYAFLLNINIFKDSQQVFAITAASTALNIAEVLGSTLGAVLYDIWGQRSVFCFLGVVSIVNQALLLVAFWSLKPGGSKRKLSIMQSVPPMVGWNRLKATLSNKRLRCAIVLIMMAAVVKGSVEEMLPFHADHEWGFRPAKIGELFSIVAFAYIVAAVCVGRFWSRLSDRKVLFGTLCLSDGRIILSAFCLSLLGAAAWVCFRIEEYWKQEQVLWGALVVYGACLGLTHTPAALLLADAIDHEAGKAKDAVNGIWNTMWEAGGSMGFFLGGFLADSYTGQVDLITAYVVCCLLCAGLMLSIGDWDDTCITKSTRSEPVLYGTSA